MQSLADPGHKVQVFNNDYQFQALFEDVTTYQIENEIGI